MAYYINAATNKLMTVETMTWNDWVRGPRHWRALPSTKVSAPAPAKPDYWWRSAYTSLRRNMNNDDLVDRFDAICGEVIDPRRDLVIEPEQLALAA